MGDLLSSASLLLAAIAMVFSVWYPEIKNLSDTDIPKHDRSPHTRKLRILLWTRALPLAFASLCVTAIYFPEFIKIIQRSAKARFSPSEGNIFHYDAVATAFILVVLLTMGLTGFLFYYVFRLSLLISESKQLSQTD
jgi:hypothetical protein